MIIKAAAIIAAAVLLLVAGILYVRSQEEKDETRGTMSEGFGQLKTVQWNGRTFREKPAVTTLLIAGTDRHGETVDTAEKVTGSKAYRSGSPADFLLLIAIDHTDKTIHQLQIDRDTMTDVTVLGTFGNEVGTRVMQICLAHYYGDTLEANAKYTIRAVENLMDGLQINGYYMVDYSAIPVLNDALGGVTVHLDFDMTSVNPAWSQGKTITLHGKEAETFVRTRQTVGAGTNEERMVRQGEFMRQAIQKMNQKISADLAFGEAFLQSLEKLATTNMTVKRLTEELNKAYKYEVQDIDHPKGTYSIGEDGFVEFHMQEGETTKWVLEHLYTEVKD